MKNVRIMLVVLGLVLQFGVFSDCFASTESTTHGQKRFRYGDWTLYFNQSAPGSIQWRGKTLIKNIYCYTAIKSSKGLLKEGFNFRDLEGNLRLVKEKLDHKIRLTWKNKLVAGEMTVQLILEKNEISIEYTGKMEPNNGFGEIGFFIPEKMVLNDTRSELNLERENGAKIDKVLFVGSTHLKSISRVKNLSLLNKTARMQLNFTGQVFEGSHGVFFQDFRSSDIPSQTGCYRVVLGFSTQKGNKLKYKWVFKLTSTDDTGIKK